MPAEVGLICRPPEVLPPEPALDEAEDDVVVANDLGRGVGEELGEKVFELILVRDNHIAVRAIAAILAHRDDMTGHDADDAPWGDGRSPHRLGRRLAGG